MRKILSFLFALLTTLIFKEMALAAPSEGNLHFDQGESFLSMAFVQDDLYIRTSDSLYKVVNEDNSLIRIIDFTESAEKRIAPQHADLLFTDGAELFAISQSSGDIYKLENGELVLSGNIPSMYYEEAKENNFDRQIHDIAYAEGIIYVLTDDVKQRDFSKQLLAIDLDQNEITKKSITKIQRMIQITESSFLLYRKEGEKSGWWEYDASLDTMGELLFVEADSSLFHAVWWDKSLFYENFSKIIRYGDNKTVSYIPGLLSNMIASKSGMVAFAAMDGSIILRKLDENSSYLDRQVLRIAGMWPEDVPAGFYAKHPEIVVEIVNPYLDRTAIITGDGDIDIYIVDDDVSLYGYMRKKGYIIPLQSNALIASVNEMYPQIKSAMFDEQNLFAYPLSMTINAWTVNATQWEKLGLGDYPATFEDVFHSYQSWKDTNMDDDDHYTFMQNTGVGLQGYMELLVKEYIMIHQANDEKPLFMNPSFKRTLLQLLSHPELYILDNNGKMPILMSHVPGKWVDYFDGEKYISIPSPTFSGMEPTISVRLMMACIGVNSKNVDNAKTFIEYLADTRPMDASYVLSPKYTQPIEEPSAGRIIAQLEEEVTQREASLNNASAEERKDAEVSLEAAKVNLQNYQDTYRWLISKEALENYHDLAQYIWIPYDDPIYSDDADSSYKNIQDVIKRYSQLKLDESNIDAFLNELDRIVEMMYKER